MENDIMLWYLYLCPAHAARIAEARSQEELYKHTVKCLSTRRKGDDKRQLHFCLTILHHLHPRYSIYYLYVAGQHKEMDG